MLEQLARVIEAASLGGETTLTVAQSSAEAPVTSGVLVVLVDDADGLERALRRYPSGHGVRVVNGDGVVSTATVAELLESRPAVGAAVVVDAVESYEMRHSPDGVRGVIDWLRDPVDGCPWDNAQTHESLRPHLLEETYEVLEAIAAGGQEELCEELGDLMMQVVLHAKLAEQDGAFTLDDVAEGIRAKLVRRHPHVFGDGSADTPQLVEGAWERLKARERPERESVLDGVPRSLPALARAQSILGRAERNGFKRSSPVQSEGVGERLLDLVQEARAEEVSAEDALRDALGAFERAVRDEEARRRSEGQAGF